MKNISRKNPACLNRNTGRQEGRVNLITWQPVS